MSERSNPKPADRKRSAGAVPPSVPQAAESPVPGVDPVEQEWRRIERERVAQEIAEAREDLIEAITHPEDSARRGSWVWWAFGLALLAGVVFALAVNLFVMPSRQESGAVPPAGDRRPPSASEVGPGVSAAENLGPPEEEPQSPPPSGRS